MAAFVTNIRRRLPRAQILAFTDIPRDTQQRHGIPAFPLRRSPSEADASAGGAQEEEGRSREPSGAGWRSSLRPFPGARPAARAGRSIVGFPRAIVTEMRFVPYAIRRLRHLDLLIIAGGGQLGDYFGGTWGYPFRIFKWCALAKAMGAKVAFVSVGAGPLRSPLSRFFIRAAVSSADYRSLRDQSSARLMTDIGVRRETLVYPDPAYSLPLPPVTRRAPRRGSLVVGINPLPYFDAHYWAEHDEKIYRAHVEVMSRFAAWLIQHGHRVCLFPTQLRADPEVIEDVRREILASGIPGVASGILERPVDGFDTLITAIDEMDAVVATRYHGIVFALQMNKPVVGVSYDPKTSDLMHDVGLGDVCARHRRPEVRVPGQQLRGPPGQPGARRADGSCGQRPLLRAACGAVRSGAEPRRAAPGGLVLAVRAITRLAKRLFVAAPSIIQIAVPAHWGSARRSSHFRAGAVARRCSSVLTGGLGPADAPSGRGDRARARGWSGLADMPLDALLTLRDDVARSVNLGLRPGRSA